jgi:hypothetical protein
MRNLPLAFLIVIASLSAGALAEGPAPDAAAKQALAKAQQMLKSMSAERDALKAENAKLNARLNAELDDMKSKLSATKSAASAAAARAAAENAAQREAIVAADTHAKDVEVKLQDTETRLTAREKDLSACTADNRKLGTLSKELLGRYADKGVMDAVLQREPLTQLKRVELENLVQQYDDRITESSVAPSQPSPAQN